MLKVVASKAEIYDTFLREGMIMKQLALVKKEKKDLVHLHQLYQYLLITAKGILDFYII